MSTDGALQILLWSAGALFLVGVCYLVHRLTAPAGRRINDALRQRHYALLAAQGREVPLPRTWLSGGITGHDLNTDPELKRVIWLSGLSIAVAFLAALWLRRDVVTFAQVLAEAALGLLIVGGVFLGLRMYGRRRVQQGIAAAGDLVPRGAFKVVANPHGLFVPVADRVIDGAWSDWSVAAFEIDIDKYGEGHCHAITLAHRDSPDRKIPLIASTFQDGTQLMAVLAARVARQG